MMETEKWTRGNERKPRKAKFANIVRNGGWAFVPVVRLCLSTISQLTAVHEMQHNQRRTQNTDNRRCTGKHFANPLVAVAVVVVVVALRCLCAATSPAAVDFALVGVRAVCQKSMNRMWILRIRMRQRIIDARQIVHCSRYWCSTFSHRVLGGLSLCLHGFDASCLLCYAVRLCCCCCDMLEHNCWHLWRKTNTRPHGSRLAQPFCVPPPTHTHTVFHRSMIA